MKLIVGYVKNWEILRWKMLFEVYLTITYVVFM